MRYLSCAKNIYIINKNKSRVFDALSYDSNLIARFRYNNESDFIQMYIERYSGNESLLFESVQLMTEILYFIGNKNKNIIISQLLPNFNKLGFIRKDNVQIKSVDTFEKERINKFDDIDDLYNFPHLVPWNLVEIEWDVLKLVETKAKKKSDILEIGSGYGKNLLALNEIGYDNVYGVENSKNAFLQSLKFQYCLEHNRNADISNLPFDDGTFDCVIDIGCLHCAGDFARKKGVQEIVRILRERGVVISRFFLTKDEEWIRKYPVAVNNFGADKDEILKIWQPYFKVIDFFVENGCCYFIGERK